MSCSNIQLPHSRELNQNLCTLIVMFSNKDELFYLEKQARFPFGYVRQKPKVSMLLYCFHYKLMKFKIYCLADFAHEHLYVVSPAKEHTYSSMASQNCQMSNNENIRISCKIWSNPSKILFISYFYLSCSLSKENKSYKTLNLC